MALFNTIAKLLPLEERRSLEQREKACVLQLKILDLEGQITKYNDDGLRIRLRHAVEQLAETGRMVDVQDKTKAELRALLAQTRKVLNPNGSGNVGARNASRTVDLAGKAPKKSGGCC